MSLPNFDVESFLNEPSPPYPHSGQFHTTHPPLNQPVNDFMVETHSSPVNFSFQPVDAFVHFNMPVLSEAFPPSVSPTPSDFFNENLFDMSTILSQSPSDQPPCDSESNSESNQLFPYPHVYPMDHCQGTPSELPLPSLSTPSNIISSRNHDFDYLDADATPISWGPPSTGSFDDFLDDFLLSLDSESQSIESFLSFPPYS